MEPGLRVTGSIVQSFIMCPRQAWLSARQICPDEDNTNLALGRLISQETYKREKKEIRLGHLCLDLVKRGDRQLIVGEVKKSSRAREAARMQLAFYLYELAEMGLEAEGELLFPEEKRKESLVMSDELILQVQELKEKIIELIAREKPPPLERISACKKCAYAELCWA